MEREKLARNVGVKGGNVNLLGEKRQFFEVTTKRKKILPGKSGIYPENRKFFRLESKFSATGFTTPQTSNQIDAAENAHIIWP